MGVGGSKAASSKAESQRSGLVDLEDKFSIDDDNDESVDPLTSVASVEEGPEEEDLAFGSTENPEAKCEWISGLFSRNRDAFVLSTSDGETPEQPPCPEPHANILSRVTFSWLDSLMVKGWKKPLEHYDLWKLNPIDRSSFNLAKFSHHWKKD